MDPENLYATPCLCITREKETVRDTFFFLKKVISLQKKNEKKKCPVSRAQGSRAGVTCCPVSRVRI
jgi:hypothetical protein